MYVCMYVCMHAFMHACMYKYQCCFTKTKRDINEK